MKPLVSGCRCDALQLSMAVHEVQLAVGVYRLVSDIPDAKQSPSDADKHGVNLNVMKHICMLGPLTQFITASISTAGLFIADVLVFMFYTVSDCSTGFLS